MIDREGMWRSVSCVLKDGYVWLQMHRQIETTQMEGKGGGRIRTDE